MLQALKAGVSGGGGYSAVPARGIGRIEPACTRRGASERNSEPIAYRGEFGIGGIRVDEQPVGIRAEQRRAAGQRQRDQTNHCDHLHAGPHSIAQVCRVRVLPASVSPEKAAGQGTGVRRQDSKASLGQPG